MASEGGGSVRGVESEDQESFSKESWVLPAFFVFGESTVLMVAPGEEVRLAAEYMATPIQRIKDFLF